MTHLDISTVEEKMAVMKMIDEILENLYIANFNVQEELTKKYPAYAKDMATLLKNARTVGEKEQVMVALKNVVLAQPVVTIVIATDKTEEITHACKKWLHTSPWKTALLAIEKDSSIQGGIQVKADNQFHDFSLVTFL